MKINLLIDNPDGVRSGYLNIDPFASGEDYRAKGDISNLDHLVDDGEAKEILALNVFDYFPFHVADKILTNWLKKLAHGGMVTISTVDVKEVARAICANALSMDEINEILHGEQTKEWQFRKASYSLSQLVEVIENLGFKIIHKRVNNYRAIVVAMRK